MRPKPHSRMRPGKYAHAWPWERGDGATAWVGECNRFAGKLGLCFRGPPALSWTDPSGCIACVCIAPLVAFWVLVWGACVHPLAILTPGSFELQGLSAQTNKNPANVEPHRAFFIMMHYCLRRALPRGRQPGLHLWLCAGCWPLGRPPSHLYILYCLHACPPCLDIDELSKMAFL